LTDADEIRARVLRAIGRNRTPGFHFPGHFLDIQWTRMERDHATLCLDDGPHIRDRTGNIDIGALAVFVDLALGTAARLEDGYHGRLATVCLHVQFTGADLQGPLSCKAGLRGPMWNTEEEYLLTEATVESNGKVACYACAKFTRLGLRSGALAPLPWQLETPVPIPAVEEATLDNVEQDILRSCDEALSRASHAVPFIRWFWGGEPARDASGRHGRVVAGPQLGNRVGHAQGGILLGLAALDGTDAVPANMRLSNATAWYGKPARPSCVSANSVAVHSGRTTALVSTSLRSSGDVVMSAMTQHVLEAGNVWPSSSLREEK
jgi:acyl-coenzyme A thioesterase PaaI-like protein